MKILLVGRWGKAHAVGKALVSDGVELFSFMDKKNPGIANISSDFHIGNLKDKYEILDYAKKKEVDLVFISPEMTLKTGVTDLLDKEGIPNVGPSKFCSKLESDKLFVRDFLKEHDLDMSPDYRAFHDMDSALSYIDEIDNDFAVKPAGVTEGDGVKVMGIQLENKQDAKDYVREIFEKNIGELPYILIEDKIEGEEFTIQAFVDGKSVVPMPVVRDYKLLKDGNQGLNTPGMGSYTEKNHLLPFLDRVTFNQGLELMQKTIDIFREEYGEHYKGILSGQFMLTMDGLKLIEFNVRAGDSEILNIVPIMKTPMKDILWAISKNELGDLNIEFENKATVCKYLVPPGFPTPKKNVEVDFDVLEVENDVRKMYQSCFEVDKSMYQPSPRTFAVTGVGNTVSEAKKNCEEGLEMFDGDGLSYRKDIGSRKLRESYLWTLEIPEEKTLKTSTNLLEDAKDWSSTRSTSTK